MVQIKIKHPAMFMGERHSELAFVYAEDENGTRYNIARVDDENDCAGSLEAWDSSRDYASEWRATDRLTVIPPDEVI